MNLLLTASTVFTLIALYFVFSMARHARRRRPVRATRSLAGGAVSACAGGASIMLAFSYYGYSRLGSTPASFPSPRATLLGLDPIFQLDRLSGRYSTVDEERSKVRSVHSLSEPVALDVWQFARKYPKLMPGVDAHYGTATYLPMAHGAIFEVTMTRTGLIARPINEEAENAVGQWVR